VNVRLVRVLDVLLIATIVVTTWAKVHWQVAGQVTLEDVFAMLFLAVFAIDRGVRRRFTLPPAARALLLVLLCLEAVYLAGFFNLDTTQSLDQYAKGMIKFLLHFSFLICGVAFVIERGRRIYWHAIGALIGGIALNCVYGYLQLAAQVGAGVNLDKAVIGPLTFGQGGLGGLNVYGQVTAVNSIGSTSSSGVFRVNALALDPNHLGIMLCVPLLLLLPFALREGVRTRLGIGLWLALGFFELMQMLTLSRSGYFGLACGLAVLAVPYRRIFFSPKLLVPVGVAFGAVALYVASSAYWQQVFRSRFTLSDKSAQVHYAIFDLVPPVLNLHPLLGLGLNTFSVYYQEQTGLTNWGPHSFYVALIAETGLIGTAAFCIFLAWLFIRLAVLHRIAEVLEGRRDRLAADVGPLAWGLTAALVATMAANVFYLTMQFYYFYALVLVIVAAPPVFWKRPAARAAS
jgi:hypothetical protein